jgi:hypothetical protein
LEEEQLMYTERSNIERIISEMARGKDIGGDLGFDRDTKTFRDISSIDPDNLTRVTPDDNIFWGTTVLYG